MHTEILLVNAVLVATVVLFVSEKLRVDVVAILIMVTLPWLGLVTASEALSGLSSNAVVSIIAVMILGYGVDRTGLMSDVTRPLMRLAGKSERRLLGVVSTSVGLISAFMQNIGAAALFLPAVMRISRRLKRPPSRLLMPMGFAAILGGTLTMVASGPLIILNDLLVTEGEDPFGLFSVTPVGLTLLGVGVLYFLVLGRRVLPEAAGAVAPSPQDEVIQAWGLTRDMFCVGIPEGSPIAGKTIDEAALWERHNLHIIGMRHDGELQLAPSRRIAIEAGQSLGVLGTLANVERFVEENGLELSTETGEALDELASGLSGGFAEVLVHPRSSLAGTTIREMEFRRHFGLEPILLVRNGEVDHHDFSDRPLEPGDTLVVHGYWDRLHHFRRGTDLVPLTELDVKVTDPSKKWIAGASFLGAIGLAVAGFPLSISLLTGALAMILLKVLSIDEAYKAVDWRTVFLLAGLIPLGIAMDKSGAAAALAAGLAAQFSGAPVVLVLVAVGALATVFSLFMSNVAATVLLVPLVMMMGDEAGIDPRGLALLVAVSASNSFLLPTHQVNALLMGPGGYRNKDYLRAGGIMTALFLAVSVLMIALFYL